MKRIIVGISACLAGLKVRYDAKDRYDPFIMEKIGDHFEIITLCPEVESGLPVPREPMILKAHPQHPRIVTISGIEFTERIRSWIERKLKELEEKGLCGFILKSGSPSCGLEVDLFSNSLETGAKVPGLFASMLKKHFGEIPCEEERNLSSLHRINNFIQLVYAYAYKKNKEKG